MDYKNTDAATTTVTYDRDKVQSPTGNLYEAIKIINNLDLNFNRGNVLKYILRAGKKDADKEIQDLQKAKHYIDYEIERLKIMNKH